MPKEYVLKNGNAKLKISSLGAVIRRYSVGGQDVFYPYFRREDEKPRGGCFICAPFFGQHQFRDYHGFLRHIEAEGIDVDKNSCELSFSTAGNPDYPWAIKYKTVIELMNDGTLMMHLWLMRGKDNRSDPAPVLPAFHPYFPCRDADEVKVSMLGHTYSGFSEKSESYELKDWHIEIDTPEYRADVALLGDFKDNLSRLVFWSDDPRKYFCVEPVFRDRVDFGKESGFYLKRGEELVIGMAIAFQKRSK